MLSYDLFVSNRKNNSDIFGFSLLLRLTKTCFNTSTLVIRLLGEAALQLCLQTTRMMLFFKDITASGCKIKHNSEVNWKAVAVTGW